MTVWEKALVNMEKGYAKLSAFAATFSERVKSDINIIRVRMQMDDARAAIAKQHEIIGSRLLEQSGNGTLPTSIEVFFKQEDIAAAIERIIKLEKDLDGLQEELNLEAASIKNPPRKEEGKAA